MPVPLREVIPAMHKVNAEGNGVTFHIVFFTQEGKRVELPSAQRCSLPPDLRGNREFVGVRPNIKGRHDYAVHQKLIVQFNKISVVY
jgi:hypothetical protein